MKSGILRESIEIWEYTVSTSDYGDTTKTWTKSYTTRANVRYNSGNKVNQNDEVFYPRTRTFIVRYYVPVSEPNRVKYDGKFWQIESIAPDRFYNDKVIIATLVNE